MDTLTKEMEAMSTSREHHDRPAISGADSGDSQPHADSGEEPTLVQVLRAKKHHLIEELKVLRSKSPEILRIDQQVM